MMGRRKNSSLFGWIDAQGGSVRYRYRDPLLKKIQSIDCHGDINLARQTQREVTNLYEKKELHPKGYVLVVNKGANKVQLRGVKTSGFFKTWLENFKTGRKKNDQTFEELEESKSFKFDVARAQRFFDIVKKRMIHDVSLEDYNRYVRERQKVVKNSSINRDLDVVKPMLKYAYDRGYLLDDISAQIQDLRVTKGKTVTVFQDLETIKKMFVSCEKVRPDFLSLLWCYMKTGLRRENAWLFQKSWVRRDINVIAPFVGKTDRTATIRTDPDFHRLLLALLDNSENKTDYLFVDRNNEPWTEPKHKRCMQAILDESKISKKLLGCNVFRHTAGSCWTKSQGIAYAAQQLAHTDINTTKEYYANVMIEYVKIGDEELPYNIDTIHGGSYWSKSWSKRVDKSGFTVVSRDKLKSISA